MLQKFKEEVKLCDLGDLCDVLGSVLTPVYFYNFYYRFEIIQ